MTIIEVDGEVYEALQGLAEPFVDDPNSVLRRLLDLQPAEAKASVAAASGQASPGTTVPRPKVIGRPTSPAANAKSSSRERQDLASRREAAVRRAVPEVVSRVLNAFKGDLNDLWSLMESLDGEAIEWIDDLPSLLNSREDVQSIKWNELLISGVQTKTLSIWNDTARTDVVGYWPWTNGAARAFGQGRARRGSLLPRSTYEMPILESLIELGGSAAASRVVDLVGAKLETQLTDIDYKETPGTRVVRWRNRTQFARHELVKKGQMRQDSPHGVWEISEAGRDRVLGDIAT